MSYSREDELFALVNDLIEIVERYGPPDEAEVATPAGWVEWATDLVAMYREVWELLDARGYALNVPNVPHLTK